jgi:hypothetical protein
VVIRDEGLIAKVWQISKQESTSMVILSESQITGSYSYRPIEQS